MHTLSTHHIGPAILTRESTNTSIIHALTTESYIALECDLYSHEAKKSIIGEFGPLAVNYARYKAFANTKKKKRIYSP